MRQDDDSASAQSGFTGQSFASSQKRSTSRRSTKKRRNTDAANIDDVYETIGQDPNRVYTIYIPTVDKFKKYPQGPSGDLASLDRENIECEMLEKDKQRTDVEYLVKKVKATQFRIPKSFFGERFAHIDLEKRKALLYELNGKLYIFLPWRTLVDELKPKEIDKFLEYRKHGFNLADLPFMQMAKEAPRVTHDGKSVLTDIRKDARKNMGEYFDMYKDKKFKVNKPVVLSEKQQEEPDDSSYEDIESDDEMEDFMRTAEEMLETGDNSLESLDAIKERVAKFERCLKDSVRIKDTHRIMLKRLHRIIENLARKSAGLEELKVSSSTEGEEQQPSKHGKRHRKTKKSLKANDELQKQADESNEEDLRTTKVDEEPADKAYKFRRFKVLPLGDHHAEYCKLNKKDRLRVSEGFGNNDDEEAAKEVDAGNVEQKHARTLSVSGKHGKQMKRKRSKRGEMTHVAPYNAKLYRMNSKRKWNYILGKFKKLRDYAEKRRAAQKRQKWHYDRHRTSSHPMEISLVDITRKIPHLAGPIGTAKSLSALIERTGCIFDLQTAIFYLGRVMKNMFRGFIEEGCKTLRRAISNKCNPYATVKKIREFKLYHFRIKMACRDFLSIHVTEYRKCLEKTKERTTIFFEKINILMNIKRNSVLERLENTVRRYVNFLDKELTELDMYKDRLWDDKERIRYRRFLNFDTRREWIGQVIKELLQEINMKYRGVDQRKFDEMEFNPETASRKEEVLFMRKFIQEQYLRGLKKKKNKMLNVSEKKSAEDRNPLQLIPF